MSLVRFLAKRERGIYSSSQRTAGSLFAEDKATIPTENLPCELSGKTRGIFLVAFSPDKRHMASTHGDHTVRVTCVETGRCEHVLRGHPRTPWCVTFHPACPEILASGCLGGEVRIWDLRGGGSEVWKSPRINVIIQSISFHPRDQVLVIATWNELLFWDWNRSSPFAVVHTEHQYERVRWVKFDPLGHFLYTGIANNSPIQPDDDVFEPVRLADMAGGQVQNRDRAYLQEQYRHIADEIRRGGAARTNGDAPRSNMAAIRVHAAQQYASRETERLRNSQQHSAFVVPEPDTLERESSPAADGLLQTVQLPSIVTSALSPYEREIRRYEQRRDNSSDGSNDSRPLTTISLPLPSNISGRMGTRIRVSTTEPSSHLHSSPVAAEQRVTPVIVSTNRATPTPTLSRRNVETWGTPTSIESLMPANAPELRISLPVMDISDFRDVNDNSEPSLSPSPVTLTSELVRVPPPVRAPLPVVNGLFSDPDQIPDPDDVIGWSADEDSLATLRLAASASAFETQAPLSDSTDTLGEHEHRPTVLRNPFRERSPLEVEDNVLAHHRPEALLESPAGAPPTTERPYMRSHSPALFRPSDVLDHAYSAPHSCWTGCPCRRRPVQPQRSSRSTTHNDEASSSGAEESHPVRRVRPRREPLIRSNLSRRMEHLSELNQHVADIQSAFHDRLQSLRQERDQALSNLRSISAAHHERVRRLHRDRAALTREMRLQAELQEEQVQRPQQPPTSSDAESSRDVLQRLRERQASLLNQLRELRAGMERPRSYQREQWPRRSFARRRVLALHPHYEQSVLEEGVTGGMMHNINRALAATYQSQNEHAVASNIGGHTHRIQRWDFTQCNLPDITQGDANIVASNVKLHNDASLDISSDGRYLAAFVRTHAGFPDDMLLVVFSLDPDSLGHTLFTKSFGGFVSSVTASSFLCLGPNAISVSISPLCNYVLVGLASKKYSLVNFSSKQMVGQVFKLMKQQAGEDSMESVCDILHPTESEMRISGVSVNSARWIPTEGHGLVYGTNRGDLHFCRPGLEENQRKTSTELSEEGRARRSGAYVTRPSVQPSTQSAATQTSRVRRSASTQTELANQQV